MQPQRLNSAWVERVFQFLGRRSIYWALVFLVFAASILANTSYLDPEVVGYLPRHFSADPFWHKVFDVGANDYGYFRARELSYFFDLIDATLLRALIQWGSPFYVSVVYYLILGLIAWRFRHFSERLKLNPALTTLIFIGALFSPVIFLSGFYYRTAKILVAGFGSFLAMELIESKVTQRPLRWGLVFGLGLGLSLVDEQGIFFLALILCFSPKKAYPALGLSFVVHVIYRFWIGPNLVTGISDQTYIVHMTIWDLLKDGLKSMSHGLQLFFRWFRFYWGNSVVLSFAMLYLIAKQLRTFETKTVRLKVIAIVIGLVMMTAFMVSRHYDMTYPDISLKYYGIPMVFVFVIGFGYFFRKPAPWVRTGFAVHFIFALAAMPGHLEVVKNHFEITRQSYIKGQDVIRCVRGESVSFQDQTLKQLCEVLKTK